ncbi:MAG: HD domain-containing protein [Deltaproteobacteria bacterium]|nr:HD domain-containing protein [Deltaproteobacteria bacterium]
MKTAFVSAIKDGDRVDSFFLVSKKDMGVSKAGKPYLAVKLMDKTGEMDARVWDNAESVAEAFVKGEVVMVKGSAVLYREKVQLNLSDIKSVAPGSYAMADFLPSSRFEPSKMIAELDAVIEAIADKHIKALLKSLFSDKSIREPFMLAPAAKGMHHPYIGGLIEHVLSLCRLASLVCSHYTGVNRDLVTAGLILHDIGKIRELSFDKSFEYTDEGRLIGHITIGVELVTERMKKLPDFPEDLGLHIKHIMLSHHNLLEFGSPKRPKTLEAIVVAYLDDLDAKVNAIESLIEQDGGDGNWTEYQRMFERYIYKRAYSSGEPQDSSNQAPKKKAENNFDLFKK